MNIVYNSWGICLPPAHRHLDTDPSFPQPILLCFRIKPSSSPAQFGLTVECLVMMNQKISTRVSMIPPDNSYPFIRFVAFHNLTAKGVVSITVTPPVSQLDVPLSRPWKWLPKRTPLQHLTMHLLLLKPL